MKRAVALGLAAVLLGFLIPALAVRLGGSGRAQQADGQQTTQPGSSPTEAGEPEGTAPPQAGPVSEGSADGSMLLRVQMSDGMVSELPLDDYLTGVVLAEMPTSFQGEALKAQAVVSRTYTLRQMARNKHDTADICTDASCCQGWMSYEDYCAKEGEQVGNAGAEAAAQAVRETDGQVLTFEGKLIDATFFSCSGGRTEAAVEVWGTEIPYLQAVDSPGEENAAHFTDTVSFSKEKFSQLIHSKAPEAALEGSPANWFGSVTATEGGGVGTLEIGGVVFAGKDLRSLLGLRSTVFSIHVSEDQIIVETKGYGHRVGMSQYGAEAMAQAGSDYRTILLHYYQGVDVADYFA